MLMPHPFLLPFHFSPDFSIASRKYFSLTLIFARGNFTKLNGNLFSKSPGHSSCGVAGTHSLEGISGLLILLLLVSIITIIITLSINRIHSVYWSPVDVLLVYC